MGSIGRIEEEREEQTSQFNFMGNPTLNPTTKEPKRKQRQKEKVETAGDLPHSNTE